MNFFTVLRLPTLRLAVCADALSLALMVSDHHRQHAVWVRSALSVVVYPLRLTVSTLFVELPAQTRWAWGLHPPLPHRRERGASPAAAPRRFPERAAPGARGREPPPARAPRVFRPYRGPGAGWPECSGVDIDPVSSGWFSTGHTARDPPGAVGDRRERDPRPGGPRGAACRARWSSLPIPATRSRSCCRAAASGASRSAADRPAKLDLAYVPRGRRHRSGGPARVFRAGGKVPGRGYPAATVVKVETARGRRYAEVRLRPLADLKRRARSSWSSRPTGPPTAAMPADGPAARRTGRRHRRELRRGVRPCQPADGGVGGGVAPAVGRPGAALLVLRKRPNGSACWWGGGAGSVLDVPRRHPPLASTPLALGAVAWIRPADLYRRVRLLPCGSRG